MYAKIFSQIFDSTLAEDFTARHVFMDLLVLADRHGVVDMTLDAIARRTNAPKAIVEEAIRKLCKPDVNSRGKTDEGRRLIPLSDNRNWGWQIVNFEHYHKMQDEHARREYMRNYMRKRRSAEKDVNTCKQCKPQLAHEDEDEDTDKDKEASPDAEPSEDSSSGRDSQKHSEKKQQQQQIRPDIIILKLEGVFGRNGNLDQFKADQTAYRRLAKQINNGRFDHLAGRRVDAAQAIVDHARVLVENKTIVKPIAAFMKWCKDSKRTTGNKEN